MIGDVAFTFAGEALSSHRWAVTLADGQTASWLVAYVGGQNAPALCRLTRRIGENLESITMTAEEFSYLGAALGLPGRIKLFKRPEGTR